MVEFGARKRNAPGAIGAVMRNITSPAQKHTVAIIEKSGAIHSQRSKLLTRERQASICRNTKYTKTAETPPTTAPTSRSVLTMYAGPKSESIHAVKRRQTPEKIDCGGLMPVATVISSQSDGSSPRGEKIR